MVSPSLTFAAPVAAVPAIPARVRPRWWRSHWFHSLLFFGLFYVLAPYDIAKSTQIAAGTTRADINEAVDKFGGGNPVRNGVIFALGAFAIVSLLQRAENRVRTRGSLGVAILLFLGWAMVSPLWGDDPFTTARKVVGMIFLCLAALAMARLGDRRGMLRFAIFSLGLFAVSGLVAEMVVGTFHPVEPGYRFAGLVHPNAMGSDCAILAVACFASARRSSSRKWLFYALTLLALLALAFTRSRTALAACAVGFGVFSLLLAGTRVRTIVLLGLTAVVTTVLVFGEDLPAKLTYSLSMGRIDSGATDVASLTGRSEIWSQLWDFVRQRLWLGYGYNSFWSPERLFEVALKQGFASPSAHSGLLDMTLGLGLVGGVLFAGVLLLGVVSAIREYGRDRQVETAFIAASLAALCVNMATESILLQATIGSFIWMIMLARLGYIEPVADSERPWPR